MASIERQKRKRRRDGLERQSHIMAVALDLFARDGYHATSVEDIIKSGHIVKSTFYFHYESKKAILAHIVEINLVILYQTFQKLDLSLGKPVREIEQVFLDTARALFNDREIRCFLKLMLGELTGLNDPFVKRIDMFFQELVKLGAALIQKAQKEGTVNRTLAPEITAINIIGGVKEILYLWLVKNEPVDIEKALNETVHFYFTGLYPPVRKQKDSLSLIEERI